MNQPTGNRADGNGGASGKPTARVPRRLVLLRDGEHGEVERVLGEYTGAEADGTGIHTDVQRFAAEHPGKHVAAEWLGPLGWTRFLWCRK